MNLNKMIIDDKFDETQIIFSFVFLAGMRQAAIQRDDVTLGILQIKANSQFLSIPDGNLIT